MSPLRIAFNQGSVHLPELDLWLDSQEPRSGVEKVFVSHAHSDHTGEHREVILSKPTSLFMRLRVGGNRLEHVLPFAKPHEFDSSGGPYRITLLPAGHILGSAMALVEVRGKSLLYTGDFKLRPGLSTEPCDPALAHGCDVLIMETTYGRPRYEFPSTAPVLQGIIRFCHETINSDETAVLLGYSLGKSQELLQGLAQAGLPIVLHGAVYNLTRIYEELGQSFPPYERYQAATARRKVLICPPNVARSAMLHGLGRKRVAVLTGWAVDSNCRFRYAADAAFPLSDHADFPDLVEFVRRVMPRQVLTLHGFASDFAATLRQMGFDARSLGEQEQLALNLNLNKTPSGSPAFEGVRSNRVMEASEKEKEPSSDGGASSDTMANSPPPSEPNSFARYAITCAAIGATNSKLEKVRLLGDYLRSLTAEDAALATVWFTGTPFAMSENRVLQVGWSQLRAALCQVAGIPESEFNQVYLKHSDLGEAALEVLDECAPLAGDLSLLETAGWFAQIEAATGPTKKIPLLVGALKRCSALEAKFLVKIITSDLRIGLKEGLVEEAIATVYQVSNDEVRTANLLTGHIGEVTLLARQNRLAEADLIPFRPIKVMLASPEVTATAIWERQIEAARETQVSAADLEKNTDGRILVDPAGRPLRATIWLEDKYDGIRCQLHKVDREVALYSRDLKDITATFPELADAARTIGADVVMDGEILAMRGEQVLPFAELQKRLGRRERDFFLGDEIPTRYLLFDLVWLNGVSLVRRSLAERRAAIELLSLPSIIRPARITEAHDPNDIEAAFLAARSRGNEGLVAKDPSSPYTPGRRGLAWLKLKKAYATLDCVVVGAEYGNGKRNAVLSDYTFAVRDDKTGELKTIGKAYTGLTDHEIVELTRHFLGKVIRKIGRYHEVEPDTVLEIAFDRIQRSSRHSSGLALRFPRILRVRQDKTPDQIDTLGTAMKLVGP